MKKLLILILFISSLAQSNAQETMPMGDTSFIYKWNKIQLRNIANATPKLLTHDANGTIVRDTNTYVAVQRFLDSISSVGSRTGSSVTSIALTPPGVIFSTPVNFSNTNSAWSATMSLNAQAAKSVFIGPISGANATPTFRALVSSDLPDLSSLYIQNQNASVQNAVGYISGRFRTSATITADSGMNVGQLVTNPSSPGNGRLWGNSTDNNLYYQTAGSSVKVLTAFNGIQNQYSSAQNAEAWISGRFRSDSTVTVKSLIVNNTSLSGTERLRVSGNIVMDGGSPNLSIQSNSGIEINFIGSSQAANVVSGNALFLTSASGSDVNLGDGTTNNILSVKGSTKTVSIAGLEALNGTTLYNTGGQVVVHKTLDISNTIRRAVLNNTMTLYGYYYNPTLVTNVGLGDKTGIPVTHYAAYFNSGQEYFGGKVYSSSGSALGLQLQHTLIPEANNETLAALDIAPTFSTGTQVTSFGSLVGGSGYTDGTYTGITFNNSATGGNRATATLVVSGGVVTSVTITNGGVGYSVGDILTVSGTPPNGSGFSITVTAVGGYTGVKNYGLRVQAGNVNLSGLPTYSSDAAAATLTKGDLYQDSSGNIHIKL